MNSISRLLKCIPYKVLLFGPWLLGVAGDWSNKLVMVVNGGTMPVRLPAPLLAGAACTQDDFGHDFIHSCYTQATHLKVLADIWTLHKGVYSLGDFLLDANDWLFWPGLAIWVALMIKNYSTRIGS